MVGAADCQRPRTPPDPLWLTETNYGNLPAEIGWSSGIDKKFPSMSKLTGMYGKISVPLRMYLPVEKKQ